MSPDEIEDKAITYKNKQKKNLDLLRSQKYKSLLSLFVIQSRHYSPLPWWAVRACVYKHKPAFCHLLCGHFYQPDCISQHSPLGYVRDDSKHCSMCGVEKQRDSSSQLNGLLPPATELSPGWRTDRKTARQRSSRLWCEFLNFNVLSVNFVQCYKMSIQCITFFSLFIFILIIFCCVFLVLFFFFFYCNNYTLSWNFAINIKYKYSIA